MARVRLFKSDDATAVAAVARKAWHYTYKDIFSKEKIEEFLAAHYVPSNLVEGNTLRNSFWVAEDKGKVIGYIQIGQFQGKMKLFRMYLDPDYIGKGVGSMLLETAEKFMVQHGVKKYVLEVHPQNKLGLSFYRRKGFYEVKDDNTDCSSECELVLEKQL